MTHDPLEIRHLRYFLAVAQRAAEIESKRALLRRRLRNGD
jgi:hypothetical protein